MSREGSITTTAAAKDGKFTVTLVGSSGQAPDDDPIRWTGQAHFALVGGELLPKTIHTKIASSADM